MIYKRSKTVLILLVLVLAFVQTGFAQDAQPLDMQFFMTFVPNIQFAPVYTALEKGYFTQSGINLIIEHGDENVGVDLIAANERQFGLVSGEEVIKARANGRPIVYIYEWFQKYPVGIVVSEASGITSVKDLAGRKVGVPALFGASYNALVALLTANDMKESDIQLDVIGYGAPDIFCKGQVEAAVVYINNEPLQIQQRADAGNCNGVTGLTVFPVSDASDLVSNGLVTNEVTIQEHPDLVQAVVSAFDSGLRDAINNPAEAYLASTKYVETLPIADDYKAALEAASAEQVSFLETDPSREAIAESRQKMLENLTTQFDAATLVDFQVLLNTIDLWDADVLGYSEESSWEVTQNTLSQMGFVTTPIDVTTAFTDQFLAAEG